METAPLKSFATWARSALIREVAARMSVVLAPSSPERTEKPGAVAALEKAVSAAGHGDTGRAVVADKVAYTWFNRILALRFMDANGYTDIGVVSPQRGREGGQPEILAEAKRGTIDTTVVTNQRTVEAITGLLDGTRRSEDQQGEAYALLLTEYCRHWNRAMPFMFEREGDYTELLIPSNLLADDSVLARAVAVLTEEVCQDVEVIGWLYQFYISERKDEVFAGFKKRRKAGAAEIPAATQLFTPHWIVRYLVENSLGRLWLLNRPTSRLADQMEYYVAPVDEETDHLKVSSPEELKIIDPACGSGHMLTYAFDLLYAIYEEEGYARSDIPELILTHNLYGTEIDSRAGALAAFALTMKARKHQRTFFNRRVKPHICVLEPVSFTSGELDMLVTRGGNRSEEEAFWNQFRNADVLGSLTLPREDLIEPLRRHVDATVPEDGDLLVQDLLNRTRRVLTQADFLSQRYSVVVANPPYMGGANMDSVLAAFAKSSYAHAKSDLFAMFIERCLRLAMSKGITAMVTMQSWMFLGSLQRLRQGLISRNRLVGMAHLGTGAFDSINGEVVSTTAFVVQNSAPVSSRSVFVRLVDDRGESGKQAALLGAVSAGDSARRYELDASELAALPGSPIAYWLPEAAIEACRTFDRLGDHSYGQPGLQTSDNARFVRLWYEIDTTRFNHAAPSSAAANASGARWFPLVKGGDFRKWFGNLEHVVDWENDGLRIKESISEKYDYLNGNVDYVVKDRGYFFRPCLTYNKITPGRFTARFAPEGTIFDVAGSAVFPNEETLAVLAFLVSTTGDYFLRALNPTVNVQSGDIARLPYPAEEMRARAEFLRPLVEEAIAISRADWDSVETAWGFVTSPLLEEDRQEPKISDRVKAVLDTHDRARARLADVETRINDDIAAAYGLSGEIPCAVAPEEVTLRATGRASVIKDLVSYAVGCMLGRYSLDEPGLILAGQGGTLQDYLSKVPNPSFMPVADNVIPVVDGDWFEDDIVARFRQFLRVAFGEKHFEDNLRFVTDALGVKDMREYFVKSFYKEHLQRYKKRPIYWMFSSPKGSFNALVSMHRYTTSTVSTVLNEYLREFRAKLDANRQHHERLAAGADTPRAKAVAQKEVDRLRKVLLELDEYEHDVLYPLATQQVQIDLDDGVKVNYRKLGAALKKIPGLEAGQ
ncbi:restriction endonuclease [Streptomyces sp. NRRL F-4711]|uniref:BREX-1 system adenine-specific DNA-methyltransferase PglX n=1 Tax=unclassified Streptomyces TaxID=2593676 RepID=UPI0004BF3E33|nr:MULTISPECIES: BREX-1 system adenine-specific DNA-methyltransferase PglX [unclassified Streptomyces]KOT97328.1 restriction endonuclease [Streptomyces sp. NRRL F-4711]